MPELKKIRQPKRPQSARCSKLFRKVRENARRNVKTARNPRANKPRPQHRSRRGTVNHSPRCVGQSLAQGTDRPSPCAKRRHHRRQHKEKSWIIVQHNPLTLVRKGGKPPNGTQVTPKKFNPGCVRGGLHNK